MEETIAQLRRQLEEERQARQDERQARQEERHAREVAEQRLQPKTLFPLLNRCHNSFSLAIQVETDASLTTQGDTTEPVNRLHPRRIIPWLDFPRLQEQIWRRLDRTAPLTSQRFPSDAQLDYVATSIQNKPIYSEASLRTFERDTVDNFVEMIINVMKDDDALRDDFGIEGQVTFYDRAIQTQTRTTLESDLEEIHLQDTGPRPLSNATNRQDRRNKGGQRQKKVVPRQKRNRRADQFCVHTVAGERQKPVYAVEFKAPHKVTIPKLVAGLHEMDLANDVIGQEGDTFEFHATRLVAALVTQLFSYMVHSGIQYGYLCTGEAFVFLHILDDPTIVEYFLCVPNQDVQDNDERDLHRTAIGQVLAFSLQALAATSPSQEWSDIAHEKLTTWKVEYLDVLRNIPETIRKDQPSSNYRPSRWKVEPKKHNTRSRARCQSGLSTPKHSSTEGSGSEEESPSPSTTAATRVQHQAQGKTSRRQNAKQQKRGGQDDNQDARPYCTVACIRGIIHRDALDSTCPNFNLHSRKCGDNLHSISSAELTRMLHRQLTQNRQFGFEPLHIRGRTGYLIKATLLTHGYTVVIKATTFDKRHRIHTEMGNYQHLRNLQGYQIPVCLGAFQPRVSYWYHGELMAQMMVMSWSGSRLHADQMNSTFFCRKRDEALAVLRSHGLVHRDSEWRNMVWDETKGCLAVIDLEDVQWLKRPRALGTHVLDTPTKRSKGINCSSGTFLLQL